MKLKKLISFLIIIGIIFSINVCSPITTEADEITFSAEYSGIFDTNFEITII